MYNFNPNLGEVDEFAYIELLDTISYDYGKQIKGYDNFFKFILANEAIISKVKNLKISPEVIIKNEYLDIESEPKGLFSLDKIMAYLFVFDYNDFDSLENIIDLYNSIKSKEDALISDEKKKTVKCFVCNKYEIMIEDIPSKSNYSDIYNEFHLDNQTNKIYNRLKDLFNSEEEAKSNLYFTSSKYDLGIDYMFMTIIYEIFERELHKKDFYEKDEEIDIINIRSKKEKKILINENNKNLNDSDDIGYWCCKKNEIKIENHSSLPNPVEILKFRDDDDNDYDNNQIYDRFDGYEQKSEKGKCLIF